MLFKRKIYNELLKWKNEVKGEKALLIEGARRIGKSTVCEEFGRKEYKSYILIDFSKESDDLKNYFLKYMNDLDTFFMLISVYYNVELYERETLFIFDEIQLFPQGRAAIKHLVAHGKYDYIETGSLISIRENVKDILIPSEERKIKMFPMDFEEFAFALGENKLVEYIRQCFEHRQPLERSLHNKAMLLFRQYLLVGGMPKVVAEFLDNNKSFQKADEEKRDILNLYRNDIMKIDARYRSKVLAIFDNIPGLLSQHEKRVVFSDVQKGSYGAQYEETFFWLADSMIANECFLCNDPSVGLALNENRLYIKCYLGDTGLLVSHAFSENALLEEQVYKQILEGELSMNEGMLYENMIAQMLVANNHKLYFYNHYNKEKKRNDMEIDFILSNNNKLKYRISPLEVKSGRSYSNKSINKFAEKYSERIQQSYIIHPRNLVEKDNILCMPTYMTFCL